MNTEPEIPFEALEPEPAWESVGNRYCPEPVAMDSLVAEMKASPMLTGIAAPDPDLHPYEGKCRQCGIELHPDWIQLERCEGWFPVNIHEECKPAYYACTGVAAIQAEQWQKICPPEFRSPWDDKKGNAGLLKKVLSYDHKQGKGLLIHGTSGAGKTRAAWQLVRQIMEQGTAVTFVESIDLPDENARDMIHFPVLVIDDLGNDKMQATKEALVLKILRSRFQWRRPTIITTQFNGTKLAERFSDGNTAQAVIRRLREFCDGVAA
jgi:hypothetical protein